MNKKPSFKPYQQHQLSLLPINLDELIPENHMVRVVDRAIESMNTQLLFDRYPGGGYNARTIRLCCSKSSCMRTPIRYIRAGGLRRQRAKTLIFCG